MKINQIVQFAKENYERIAPRQQALAAVTEFRVLYARTGERKPLTDEFYLWYLIKYLTPAPLVSTICPPAENKGPFKNVESSPVRVVDEYGDCEVCAEEDAQFWTIYARPTDDHPVYLADCETKEAAQALERRISEQLKLIVADALTFTAGNLLRATALALYAMQKV
jgi:hypothetical protein